MPLATNFRRDLAGKVYQLSQYAALQPVADKNYDVSKMNERFIKIHNAVRVCFDAIADIASRDSTFLPAFFQGFVNPIYTKSTAYENKGLYKLVNGFNTNGTPVTFPEERIVYSYPDIGDITTEDYEYLLFKNGELMDSALYTVDNSAFGIKAYVKSSAVANGDTITMAVHRVFNRNYQMWKKVFSAASNGLEEIIDVAPNFPNFYNAKYIRLAVRSSTASHYTLLDTTKYNVLYDSANQKLRLVIDASVKFSQFDTLIAYDCTSFWKTTKTWTNNTGAAQEIEPVVLTQTLGSGENVPVGVLYHRDLDVWVNGRHLIPGKHFVITPGYDGTTSQWRIDFLITVPNGTTVRVDVMKNAPYIPEESTYVIKDEMDENGIEYIVGKYPVLAGMGEMYINGRFVDPKNISAAHKTVLLVNNATETKDFFYKFMPPAADVTNSILAEHMSRVTEFDQTVEALGGVGELISRLKVNRPAIADANKPDVVGTLGGAVVALASLVSEDVASFIVASAVNAASTFSADANVALDASQWDISLLTSDAAVDANVYVRTNVTLDFN